MKKKIMALFLSLALCASLLAACGEKEKEKEGNGDADPGTEESGDPVKLTVWVPDSTRIEDWNTNEMTLWLEEQANVDLDIVVLSSDDYSTKVNMALTAGKISDLPDIILGSSNFSSSMVYDWAKAEAVLSLTDYYNDPDLAVNINEAIERTGVDYTKHITSPDGNIYGIASYNQSYGNEYPNKLWIYKPWLDALGKDVPTTTEEFYELLKLVSETDLNGNGKNDEIGMAGSSIGSTYGGYLITLMDAFAYAGDTNYLAVNDGVVSASYTTDEWKKGLEYTAKLFSEELIATESLTMSSDEFSSLMNTDDQVVFSFAYYTANVVTVDSSRQEGYVCIDTLTGPDGVNYAAFRPTTAGIKMVVTANCKNPEAAFRVGDLMSSEYIGIIQRWGKEGVTWDYADKIDDPSKYAIAIEGFDPSIIVYGGDAGFWSSTEAVNYSWRQTGPYVRQYGILCGMMDPVGEEGVAVGTQNLNAAYHLYQTSGHAPKEYIDVLIYTDEETDAISEIESVLKSYVQEYWAGFVSGSKSIDAEWDNYLAELNKIGLEKYLEVVQTAYDRQNK